MINQTPSTFGSVVETKTIASRSTLDGLMIFRSSALSERPAGSNAD